MCPLLNEVENVVHTLLKFNETQRWRARFQYNELLCINEEIA